MVKNQQRAGAGLMGRGKRGNKRREPREGKQKKRGEALAL